MPDLNFQVYEAEAEAYAASPLLVFKLGIANVDPEELIHTVALRCQVQIETTRRHYTAAEQRQLRDLFGEPERWNQTLRTMLWTHTSAIVQSFTDNTIANLPVPCTFDFNIAATKYFAGLETGEIPLTLQFSGTIFYADSDGALQVAQISWSKEARYRMPVKIWHDMMEMYYPNSAWLRLRRDVFDRLYEYKMQRGIPTWEQTIDRILAEQPATKGEQK